MNPVKKILYGLIKKNRYFPEDFYARIFYEYYQGEIDKPKKFTEMIELASMLSKKLPFVRVDLYEVDDKIYFGELTIYPSDARKNFYPESFNQKVSEFLELPKLPEVAREILSL